MPTAPIFIVDEIIAKPGQGEAVRSLYLESYAPNAGNRGMTLQHSWISPPLTLRRNQSNKLTFVWSVEGVPGWWKMRQGALADPWVGAFWAGLGGLIERRERSFHGEVGDV